ncbi:uncharacterized protein EI97DRAFT_385106 [Westerdykella ornata]|uniref:RFX-type winged-helix domain-containing protein n=1 Tax=Westerdykella ornata TaxID=318751 RepID=A0A6A6J859_WESOR|nr:uncharacterized protein EI97DRAFT_385106 [Westerdykella ornata]KAF2272770.1 hypothetical protein EI97DRAFT_385106 [Westerdykella ornata]
MAHRSHSNTSISTRSNRPLSRASTTSIHSFDQHDQSHDFQTQYTHQSALTNTYPTQFGQAYAPLEPALLQAAQHASQQESISIDSVQRLMSFSADPSQQSAAQHPTSQQPYDASQAAHALQAAMSQPPQQLMGTPMESDEKKKKGSASASATNDKELREMLAKNEGRRLEDVAAEVIATDRTSKAEKSKQLFAMLWLKSVCRVAKTSVPRNRVYSRYADRCGTERVIPLNPASFGKLVRVIFPGIQTRRLGVRGESKYHYVDLALINDGEERDDGRRPGTSHMTHHDLKRQASMGPKIDFNSMPRLPADTAVFPQEQAFESQSGFVAQTSSKGLLFTDIYSDQYRSTAGRQTSDTYEYELRFATSEQMAPEEPAALMLPDITPYLPPRTDPDAAQALVALYRTHCTSLIDSVRFCKEKQFFRLFSSFHGTLTVPVQKLFAQREVVPWIRECDWIMYQKMIRNLSQLTLQVAPPPVLKFLDNVEKNLRPHLCKVFSSLPIHVLEARLEPATLFAHLLRQMLRVNSTAHAAAVLLMSDQNRDQMWADWRRLVNLKRIIENELPHSCGHEAVYNILNTEIRGMLLPLRTDVWLPDGTFYQEPVQDATDLTNETVIDRIAAFLTRLPSRFPHVPARTILHCVNALGSAALREITVENGQSFQGWWLTKVFIDEMGQWLASLGGFLAHTAPNWSPLSYSPTLVDQPTDAGNEASGSNNDSRFSSIDAEFGPSQNQSFVANGNPAISAAGDSNTEITARQFTQSYDQMSFNLDLDLATSQQEPSHDDSGILLEEHMDTKYAQTVHQAFKSHLAHLPAGVS